MFRQLLPHQMDHSTAQDMDELMPSLRRLSWMGWMSTSCPIGQVLQHSKQQAVYSSFLLGENWAAEFYINTPINICWCTSQMLAQVQYLAVLEYPTIESLKKMASVPTFWIRGRIQLIPRNFNLWWQRLQITSRLQYAQQRAVRDVQVLTYNSKTIIYDRKRLK